MAIEVGDAVLKCLVDISHLDGEFARVGSEAEKGLEHEAIEVGAAAIQIGRHFFQAVEGSSIVFSRSRARSALSISRRSGRPAPPIQC
jgi:hypothetical protein